MPFMNCTRCGLSVRIRAPYLLVDHCPRCLVRRRLVVPMSVSERAAPLRPDDTADAAAVPNRDIEAGVMGDDGRAAA